MKYTYTAAWSVVGGISLQEDCPPVILASSKQSRFILTRNPDALLEKCDEGSAVARIFLKGLFGQRGAESFKSVLLSEIEEIKAERQKKAQARPILVFQAHGEIDASMCRPSREHDKFIVTFDAVEKNSVRQRHKADIEAMKVAIACECAPSCFDYISDGTCLFNEENKPVYSLSFTVSAQGSVSKILSENSVARIAGLYTALNRRNDIDSVKRQFSQVTECGTDGLKAFLSGWTALEILIAKSFKIYEQEFLSPFINGEHPMLRKRFLERIGVVMKDKYSLVDKCTAVTAVLFPGIDGVEAERNCEDFRKLKSFRDSILHGEPFSEDELPVHEMTSLLRKYVVASIGAPN